MNVSKFVVPNLISKGSFPREKVFLLAGFKFLISLVYTLLTVLKEPLVMMSAGSGAEVLPVLKGMVVFPASILFVIVFSWLSGRFHPTKIFFGLLGFFLVFLSVYNFVLRPNEEMLTISEETFTRLRGSMPHLKLFFVVYRDWMHALCFTCIELYGQVVIFLIFWGVANDLCGKEEAKGFYPIFIMAGCIGGLLGTEVNIYFLKGATGKVYEMYVLDYLFMTGIGGIGLILVTYTMIYKKYYSGINTGFGGGSRREVMSFSESMRYVFSNRYLFAIAAIVVACGLSINLVDVTYKANLKALFATKLGYQLFTAKVTRWLQIVSAFLALSMSRRIMSYLGWRMSSLLVPLVIVSTGVLFFLASKFRDYLGFLEGYGVKPLVFIVYLGVFQTLISKVVKYVFFDSGKEMAYLGLDREMRIKGKGAVDLIGSRCGKSFSGYIHIALMSMFTTVNGEPNVLNLTHILLVVLLLIGGGWFWAVGYIDSQMNKK